MGLTVTPILGPMRFVVPGGGNVKVGIFEIAWDNDYPTGGEAVTPADFNMEEIEGVFVEQPDSTDYGYVSYDRAARKFEAFTAIGTEVGSGGNLSDDDNFRVFVVGR